MFIVLHETTWSERKIVSEALVQLLLPPGLKEGDIKVLYPMILKT